MKFQKNHREERKFGIGVGVATMFLFGFFFPWLFKKSFPVWPFWIGVPLVALGVSFPKVLRPIYLAWMKLAELLAWVNTRIILGVIFFLVFTPIALVLRLLRKDLLGLRRMPNDISYWDSAPISRTSQFERPF